MPFDQQEFDVLRAFEGAPGSPAEAPTANPIDSDPVLHDLVAARALLSDPARWAKGNYCVGAAGDAFCMLGAIRHVRGPVSTEMEGDCSDTAIYLTGFVWEAIGRSTHLWNDSPETTHADMLAMLDRAIAARKAA